MTLAIFSAAPRPRFLGEDPRFGLAAIVLAALCGPLVMALLIDTLTYLGENVWVKPLKFAASIMLFVVTLAWSARYIPERIRQNGIFALYQWIVLTCIAGEMLWIIGAAALGIGSHFNTTTPLMATLYGLMGILAVTLTSAAAVYGALIWRHSIAPESMPIALSFIATSVATVIVASHLAQNMGHHVGVESADAARFWLTGWSREVGDLRVPHFFATHIMQMVPLAWFALAWFTEPPRGAGIVLTALAVAVTAATFVQARLGQPFLPALF